MINTKLSPKRDWQQELIQAVTDPRELCQILELNPDTVETSGKAILNFPLKVPRGFIARMQKGNPDDPLLRQVLPLSAEDQERSGYSSDPLGEEQVNPVSGLLHKYQGRVLLTLTGVCAINCRYCFRLRIQYHPGKYRCFWCGRYLLLMVRPLHFAGVEQGMLIRQLF